MTPAHIISIFITTHLENTVFIFLWEKEAMKVIMWPWLRETNRPEAKGTLNSSFLHGGSGPFRIPWAPFMHLFIQQPFNEYLLCARLWEHSEQHTKAMLSWVQSLQGEADIEWMSTARKTRSLAGISVLKGLCPSKTFHREAETDSEICHGDWNLHRKPRALPTEESKQVQGESHWITAIQSGHSKVNSVTFHVHEDTSLTQPAKEMRPSSTFSPKPAKINSMIISLENILASLKEMFHKNSSQHWSFLECTDVSLVLYFWQCLALH